MLRNSPKNREAPEQALLPGEFAVHVASDSAYDRAQDPLGRADARGTRRWNNPLFQIGWTDATKRSPALSLTIRTDVRVTVSVSAGARAARLPGSACRGETTFPCGCIPDAANARLAPESRLICFNASGRYGACGSGAAFRSPHEPAACERQEPSAWVRCTLTFMLRPRGNTAPVPRPGKRQLCRDANLPQPSIAIRHPPDDLVRQHQFVFSKPLPLLLVTSSPDSSKTGRYFTAT